MRADASSISGSLRGILTARPLLLGLVLRLALSCLLPLFLDDGVLLQGVRYTDIDYSVFTDAAEHVASGRSPFERHTYRYTPFLAAVLALRWDGEGGYRGTRWRWGPLGALMGRKYFGRVIFCVADAVCGQIILALRRRRRRKREEGRRGDDPHTSVSDEHNKRREPSSGLVKALRDMFADEDLVDALWWMYNPLPINICTRGSAESFVVILPVLVTLALAGSGGDRDGGGPNGSRVSLRLRSIAAGIFHGVGMHFKLYPVIYTASYTAHFARLEAQQIVSTKRRTKSNADRTGFAEGLQRLPWSETLPPGEKSGEQYPFPWFGPRRLFGLVFLWIRRLLVPSALFFLLTSLGTFATLTYAAVVVYGRVALEEGFLYHLSRVDHRHNYSMYWYWIYLARDKIAGSRGVGGAGAGMAALSRLLTLPQLVLLVYASLGIAPYDLPLALFLQTFLFVAYNKVITAQYFTWYLCLLPLCSESVRWNTGRMRTALVLLGTSIAVWLGSAFCLEMKGLSVHRWVWAASVGFFFDNVNLMGAILAGYSGLGCSKSKDTVDGIKTTKKTA